MGKNKSESTGRQATPTHSAPPSRSAALWAGCTRRGPRRAPPRPLCAPPSWGRGCRSGGGGGCGWLLVSGCLRLYRQRTHTQKKGTPTDPGDALTAMNESMSEARMEVESARSSAAGCWAACL